MRNRKFYILLFVCFVIYQGIVAQQLSDSIKNVFSAAKNNSDRGIKLNRYYYTLANDDSIFQRLISLKEYFKTIKDASAEDYVGLFISRNLSLTESTQPPLMTCSRSWSDLKKGMMHTE